MVESNTNRDAEIIRMQCMGYKRVFAKAPQGLIDELCLWFTRGVYVNLMTTPVHLVDETASKKLLVSRNLIKVDPSHVRLSLSPVGY